MTFLRWAGSKKQLLDTLSCCWFASRTSGAKGRYIEAFSGSGALFFRLRPKSAILVDINATLQLCMREVRADPVSVSRALNRFARTEDEYYRIRAADTRRFSKPSLAARFIYLNRYCFNGLYRTNLQGTFNVPYGAARSGNVPTLAELRDASAALKSAIVLSGDFYTLLEPRIGKGDFVYLDPPYATRNVNLDNQYGSDVFGTNDIRRLCKLTDLIHSRGAHFVVSYANCEEVSALTNKWVTHEVVVKRTIAANVLHRGLASEVVVTNI